MKISQYIKEYTSDKFITLNDVFKELREFLIEILRFNSSGVKEEFGDFLHHLQLWLYSVFNIDGEIWKITTSSVKKFIYRKKVWNEIYTHVGLPKNISGYCGNYMKLEKIINHLKRFDISKEKAEDSYNRIVLKK